MVKEELVIDAVHNKVNKKDIYLIWIMKKLLTELDPYLFEKNFSYWKCEWFWMFILNKEEKSLLKWSKISHVFLNFYKSWFEKKLKRIILEYELNDEYTLVVYCFSHDKKEIDTIIKSNIFTLQSVFKDENLKVFQPKLLDIFWLYWSFTSIQIIFHYLNEWSFKIQDVFWEWSVRKSLWKLWDWDVTIDIFILERIIQEWKERFQDKLDLLYLLCSNINKKTMDIYYSSLFFDFLEVWIWELQIEDTDIEDQDSNWKFKTYSIKMHYLCSYLFKEFFNDYVYWWSKKIIAFYNWRDVPARFMGQMYDSEYYIEKYKKFDLEYLKKAALVFDK